MMHFNDINMTDTTFSHLDDDGTFRLFNITALDRRVQEAARHGLTIHLVPVEDEAKPLFAKRGLEEHRLNRITYPFPPILVAEMADATHLIVDGNHRYFRCYSLGMRECPAYIIPEAIWSECLIDMSTIPWLEGVPKADIYKVFLRGHSGIA